MSDLEEAVFRAGFAYARRLTDPGFRRHLKDIGWRSGQHVMMTVDTEPVIDVINRVSVHTTDGHAMIAIVDDAEPYGFRFMFVEPARKRDRFLRPHERITLDPSASIGMLYTALEPVGTYVPSDWNRALRFEKAAAAA